MPAPINIPVYSDALVVLGTAGIVIPLVRRFGLNPVLGYLGAGAILGPLGLGSFMDELPLLYWITVVDAKNVSGFADLGIVFLLFLIGMELSYRAAEDDAPADFRARQPANRAVDSGIARHRGPGRRKPPAAAHPRRLPRPVLNGHRHRGAVQPTPVEYDGRPRQFRHPAGAGSGGRAAPAVHLHLRHRRGRLGVATSAGADATRPSRSASSSLSAAWSMRPLFRLVASAGMSELFVATTLFVIVGSRSRRSRGRPVDGAWRLRRRPAAGRNRIPQGDRDRHRSVQGPAAGPVLLHRRHEHRFPRARPRSGLAAWRARRPDRHEGHHPHRPRPAVSPVLARLRSKRACCSAPAASSPSSPSAWRQRSA